MEFKKVYDWAKGNYSDKFTDVRIGMRRSYWAKRYWYLKKDNNNTWNLMVYDNKGETKNLLDAQIPIDSIVCDICSSDWETFNIPEEHDPRSFTYEVAIDVMQQGLAVKRSNWSEYRRLKMIYSDVTNKIICVEFNSPHPMNFKEYQFTEDDMRASDWMLYIE